MNKKTFKILRGISATILLIAFLSVFAYFVRHVSLGGNKLGPLAGPLKALSVFPGQVIDVLSSKDLRGIPATYIDADPDFESINKLDYDVYGLNSYYNAESGQWDIKLFNFRNDEVAHSWFLNSKSYTPGYANFSNSELRNPILMPDRGLIIASDETNNLYRLDSESNILWHNTNKVFHHAMNLANDGNIWVCSAADRAFVDGQNEEGYKFRDDFITKIDIATGEVLFDKSITEILLENGLKNFVYGNSNDRLLVKYAFMLEIDPLHLNDIEPVYEDGTYWKKGDLFLSIRNRSIVVQYRPETNEVVRLIFGDFIHQHDVDIVSDSVISIFNNNVTNVGDLNTDGLPISENLQSSEVVTYNMADSTVSQVLQDQMIANQVLTRSQGFQQLLSTGDMYIEDQNNGKVYIMNEKEVLLKKQFPTLLEGMVEQPHWIRIYEDINF